MTKTNETLEDLIFEHMRIAKVHRIVTRLVDSDDEVDKDAFWLILRLTYFAQGTSDVLEHFSTCQICADKATDPDAVTKMVAARIHTRFREVQEKFDSRARREAIDFWTSLFDFHMERTPCPKDRGANEFAFECIRTEADSERLKAAKPLSDLEN